MAGSFNSLQADSNGWRSQASPSSGRTEPHLAADAQRPFRASPLRLLPRTSTLVRAPAGRICRALVIIVNEYPRRVIDGARTTNTAQPQSPGSHLAGSRRTGTAPVAPLRARAYSSRAPRTAQRRHRSRDSSTVESGRPNRPNRSLQPLRYSIVRAQWQMMVWAAFLSVHSANMHGPITTDADLLFRSHVSRATMGLEPPAEGHRCE